MTDEERAAFDNLLLLCKPHHDLVDRVRPDDYDVETLQSWKREREGPEAEALRGLDGLTESRLSELLEAAMRQVGPKREVTVELAGGALVPGTLGLASGPVDYWRELVDNNRHLHGSLVLLVIARNTGGLPASVESFNVYLRTESGVETALIGRNDFPQLNPDLPCSLPSGESAKWLTSIDTLRLIIETASASGVELVTLRATVSLGSGETITSSSEAVDYLPV